MGCDIHMWFEVKREGKWEATDKVRVPCRMCGYMKSPCPYCNDTKRMWPGERHYAVFNLLAGVRGCDDDPRPISEPRGLPKDLAEHPDYEAEEEGPLYGYYPNWHPRCPDDLHSHSWLTLSELQVHRERFPGNAEMLVVIDEMAKLGNPDEVRMVFAFDN